MDVYDTETGLRKRNPEQERLTFIEAAAEAKVF